MVYDLAEFQSRLNYRFRDPALLRMALTHPSISKEVSGEPHNQRLEFLGDAVLQLALTHELYHRFPEYGEGPMTKARAQLVNRKSLADQGNRLELGKFMFMSRGEEASGGRSRPSGIADAFESLLGAIYLDSSYEVARIFVLRMFDESLEQMKVSPNLGNPKGELQEFLQADTNEAPQYKEVSTSGPDHDRVFECAVFHRGAELARGVGKNKKDAEAMAATVALEKLKGRKKDPAEDDSEKSEEVESTEKSKDSA
jgi:ribonuclease-3